MVAGGALYVRHPARRSEMAVRASSDAGFPPAQTTGLQPSLVANARSSPGDLLLYRLVTELRPPGLPSTTVPVTTSVAPVAAKVPPPITVAVTVPTSVTVPAIATTLVSTTTTTTTTPVAPLLQQLAPVALGVLGLASWFNAPDGTCAHRDLPLGTIVKVTRTATGVSTTCKVNDRGPTLATNRVIDLSLDVFEKLASPDAGVIQVRIEW
jgi:hypothetical protein